MDRRAWQDRCAQATDNPGAARQAWAGGAGALSWRVPSQRSAAPPTGDFAASRASELHFATLFDGERWHADVELSVDELGRIAGMRTCARPSSEVRSFRGMAAPGFIDLQVNGVAGVAFNDGPDAHSFDRATSAMRELGVCHYLATIITDARAHRRAARQAVVAARRRGSEILGVHYEGPYIEPARRGVHPIEHVRSFDDEDRPTQSDWRTGGVDLITVAPEHVPPSQISELVARGFVVSLGHTDASYAQVIDALEAGASGLTHFFNAMSPLHHRAPGAVGAGLERAALHLGLIVDGHHVDDAVLRMLIATVGPTRLCVVSDGMPAMGRGGEDAFSVAGRELRTRSGRLVDAQGRLAGARLGLGPAVRRLHDSLDVPWDAAFRMVSRVPARWLGIDDELGWLRPGHRASLTVLDSDGEVTATIVDGDVRSVR